MHAMVLYTDGGCRPNPGFGGYGIHGYLFDFPKSIKGIGHTTHTATAAGYYTRSEASGEKLSAEQLALFEGDDPRVVESIMEGLIVNRAKVNITDYIDIYGSINQNDATNNLAELVAMKEALLLALEYNICSLVVRPDSQLVISGVTEWIHGWIERGFISSKGTPVKYESLWMEIHNLHNRLLDKGVKVTFDHVKAHGAEIGNNSADYLATMGVFAAQKGRVINQRDKTAVSVGADYWASNSDKRHPMLSHKYSYFIANKDTLTPGTYYIGNQGKEVDMIAKKSSVASYALVRIDKGDEGIEFMQDHQCGLANELESLCMLDIDSLYGPSYRYTNQYREDYLYKPMNQRFDVHSICKSPLVRELTPVFLAMRAIDSMMVLSDVLDSFLKGEGDYVLSSDITCLIYEESVVTSKPKKGVEPTETKTVKLLTSLNVGLAELKAQAKIRAQDVPSPTITLTLGIDIPDRNTLKRLESLNPSVHLVTWGRASDSFHYATVIKADGCVGIWAGTYSNLHVLDRTVKA